MQITAHRQEWWPDFIYLTGIHCFIASYMFHWTQGFNTSITEFKSHVLVLDTLQTMLGQVKKKSNHLRKGVFSAVIFVLQNNVETQGIVCVYTYIKRKDCRRITCNNLWHVAAAGEADDAAIIVCKCFFLRPSFRYWHILYRCDMNMIIHRLRLSLRQE